jgi:hypothetical protein
LGSLLSRHLDLAEFPPLGQISCSSLRDLTEEVNKELFRTEIQGHSDCNV